MSQVASILYWTPQSATSVAGEYRENGDKWTHGWDLVFDFIRTYVCCPKIDACPTTSMYVQRRNLCTNTNCLTSCVKVAPNLRTLSLQRRSGVRRSGVKVATEQLWATYACTYACKTNMSVRTEFILSGRLGTVSPSHEQFQQEDHTQSTSLPEPVWPHPRTAWRAPPGPSSASQHPPWPASPSGAAPCGLHRHVRTHTYHSWLVKP